MVMCISLLALMPIMFLAVSITFPITMFFAISVLFPMPRNLAMMSLYPLVSTIIVVTIVPIRWMMLAVFSFLSDGNICEEKT